MDMVAAPGWRKGTCASVSGRLFRVGKADFSKGQSAWASVDRGDGYDYIGVVVERNELGVRLLGQAKFDSQFTDLTEITDRDEKRAVSLHLASPAR